MFSLFVYVSMSCQLPAVDLQPPRLEILVHARAREVVLRDDYSQLTTFVIEHVYLGSRDLLGQTFVVYSASRDQVGSTLTRSDKEPRKRLARPSPRSGADEILSFDPLIRKGEEGIWRLRHEPTRDRLVPCYPESVYLDPAAVATPVPARKVLDYYAWFRYRDALQWARTVETITAAPADKRIALLQEHCGSENRHIAAWSVHALVEQSSSAVLAFLRTLALKQATCVAAQISADAVLLEHDAAHWGDSLERRGLLKRWVSLEIGDNEDFDLLCSYVRRGLKSNQLDWKVWLPLLLRTEEEYGSYSRELGMSLLEEHSPEAETVRQVVFPIVLKELQSTTARKRERMEPKLWPLYPLRPKELAALDTLARETSDMELAATLKAIREGSERRRRFEEQWNSPPSRAGQPAASGPPPSSRP